MITPNNYPHAKHVSPETPIDSNFAEVIQRHAFLDMYAAAPTAFTEEVMMKTFSFGGNACFAIKTMPSPFFNRCLASRFEQSGNGIIIKQWMMENASDVWSIGLTDSREMPDAGSIHGLQQSSPGIAKFILDPLVTNVPQESNITIREVGRELAEIFGNVVVGACGVPDCYQAWFAAIPGRPQWRTYIAFENEQAIGVSALFLHEGYAWCGIGGTLPEYRGKGVQGAMLARRINDARLAGAKGIAVDTENPAFNASPGPSYRNIVRAGFTLSHVRKNFVIV